MKEALTWRHATIIIPKGATFYRTADHQPRTALTDIVVPAKIICKADRRIYKARATEIEWHFLHAETQYYIPKSDCAEKAEIADHHEASWQARLRAAEEERDKYREWAAVNARHRDAAEERVKALSAALDSILNVSEQDWSAQVLSMQRIARVTLRPSPPAALPAAGDDDAGELAGESVGA